MKTENSDTTGAAGEGAETAKTAALRVEVRDDGVAILTYDVQGEPVNTLQASFAADFDAVYERLRDDASIKAAVLVSGKRDSWVAGANLDMLEACATAEEAEALCRVGKAAMNRLEALDKPVVAAIHGAALGGGLELAMVCAARIASDDPKTVLGLPEVQLGLLPGANGLQRLARLVGLQDAMDMGLTGKNVRPAKAKKLGLVDEVVPKAILLDVAVKKALELAERGKPKFKTPFERLTSSLRDPKKIAALALEETPIGQGILFKKAREMTRKKTRGHYPATERILDVLESFARKGWDASSEVESKAFGELVVSDVARQLIGIFFATQALKKDPGTDDAEAKPAAVKAPARVVAV